MPSSRSGDHTRQSSTDRRGYSLSSPAQEQATKSGMLTYDELIAPLSFSNSAPHTILDRETGREESRFSSEQSMNCSDSGANRTTDETISQQHQLDEAFINSEWETYLMSTDQPSLQENASSEQISNGLAPNMSEVVYLTDTESKLFSDIPDPQTEKHLRDIGPLPLSNASPTSPLAAQNAMTPTAFITSVQEEIEEKGDCEKGISGAQLPATPRKRYCGCNRASTVIACFGILVSVSVALAFIWPRLPLMQLEGSSLTGGPDVTYNPTVTKYEASWILDVATDNRNNYVPITVVAMDTFVRHSLTGTVIGRGQQQNVVLRPTTQYKLPLPIDISYQAKPDDPLMHHILSACGPGPKTNTTQPLQVDFGITIHIWGLSYFGYRPTVTLGPPAGGFKCPISVVE